MKIETAAFAFQISGTPISCNEFGSGHINTTLLINTDDGHRYVLQKINRHVFPEPEKVMANASAVTEHLCKHCNDPYCALHFLTTHEGKYYHIDEDGEYWRMYHFVPGFALNAPECDEDFYQSALAFGRFQGLMGDFPPDQLYRTIPKFHNTIDRYRQLRKSVDADPMGRLDSVREELRFLLDREELAGTLQRMQDAGELPLRVTHNDTKLNNVLLDLKTRRSLCVLDLDTVMPGLCLHDFGDSIRFGASTGQEDNQDPTQNRLDLHLFEVYTKGYLTAAPNLTENEIKMLHLSPLIMTLELASRFLKDYLDGDLYFKTDYPEHNLLRTRNQICLAADMETKLPEMERIVKQVRSSLCNT